jgi:hypothetical protein
LDKAHATARNKLIDVEVPDPLPGADRVADLSNEREMVLNQPVLSAGVEASRTLLGFLGVRRLWSSIVMVHLAAR